MAEIANKERFLSQMNRSFSELPDLSKVALNVVNKAGDAPGALSWAGNVVRLTELLYDFLENQKSTSLETVLDWQSLQDALETDSESAPTIAIRRWFKHPMLDGMPHCYGPTGLMYVVISPEVFRQMADSIRDAISQTK